jgi:hypothetical protein
VTVQIVRFTTTDEHVPEIDGAAAAMIAALDGPAHDRSAQS